MTRVRFAPSPTGYLHIGGGRTALFNYLYAKKEGGKLLLRIEDTDLIRSEERFTEQIISSLKWLGINSDENPIDGGPHAPYVQSQRLDIYKKYAQKLVDEKKAYYCFCADDELKKDGGETLSEGGAVKYSGKCLGLSGEEAAEKLKNKIPYTIRFKAFKEDTEVNDEVRGKIVFPAEQTGDFIIIKSNGTPSYNFAVVVDDALMGITHILRGDDHLSNTPRQIMIYKALEFEIPKFAHISMILGPDGKRLSKRHGASSIEEFQKEGYLPEAVFNFLSLLGWSHPEGKEIMTKDEVIQNFSLSRITTSPAVFNTEKLNWMNKHYISALADEDYLKAAEPFIPGNLKNSFEGENLKKIILLLKRYISKFSDIKEHSFYFTEFDKLNDECLTLIKDETAQKVIKSFYEKIKTAEALDYKAMVDITKEIQADTGAKGKNLYMPLRVAVTGALSGPEFPEVAEILGKNKLIERLEKVLSLLNE